MNAQVVAAIIAGALTVIGTLAAQYFGRRATSRDTQKALEEQGKQLDRTLAEQRDRTLNERFATAADRLGSNKPPAVQLAGVYAMAGLADDWEKNRQTCVDVLCAYLRMPYKADPGAQATQEEQLAFQANREVRHTVIRVITAHLKDGAATSWRGLNFDFTAAVFDGGDFGGTEFSGGTIAFIGAKFSGGPVDFRRTKFSGGRVDFRGAEFSGATVDFSDAEFSGGTVVFRGGKFSGGWVGFNSAEFSGATVDFSDAEFSGGRVVFIIARFAGGAVAFIRAKFSGGTVGFRGGRFAGGAVAFSRAEFSGSEVDFSVAKFSGGTVGFNSAVFSACTVDFSDAVFSGATVDFSDAEFSGGKVDFRGDVDWSFPPAFPWKDTPPRGVKLPKKEDQSQA